METISKKSLEVLSGANATSDYCHNSKSPSYLVTNDQYFQIIKQLKAKGIRQRFITEITQENVRYSKELANYVELRHLEGVKGNFGIVDGKEYGAAANIYDLQPPVEFIYSNVKTFVDQQQYFFETLWNKAIPAEKKIREIEEGIPAEVTEIWYGADNIVKKQLQIITKAQATVDYCHSSESPSIIATFEPFMQTIIRLNKRGVKQRYITEITEGNIQYCKELAKYVQLRHLDHVQGTLGIIDGKIYGAIANTKENHLPTEFIYSNVTSFIDQQQYFFETLWNKAISAGQRIREIEEGIPVETTEIIDGTENILNKAIEGLSLTKGTFDNCIDRACPSSYVLTSPIWNKCIELFNRGVRLRFITEITSDNVSYCKDIMKISELRHLDGIMGNFGISDGRDYRATASMQQGQPPTHAIRSTIKTFVDQQQYFFETLWNKAISAEQRIKEIEEGRPPEKLEIIQDTQKSISRAFDIMNKTQKELLVLFATPRTFTIALQAGAADIYRKMSANGININVLVPRRGGAEIEEHNEQQIIARVREEISPSINIRFSDVDLNTRITIMISDRKEFMSWELRDDTLDDPYLAGGIATYSNIKSLASSYATIFDNLWKITELAENLRIANIKLESNEKAMKEFINIAAHELRTPIQPILGLSEMLHSVASNTDDPQRQRKFIDVIIRNAHKLENLAEDILDVTRIDSGRLQLSMEKIDLHELVKGVVSDFQAVIKSKFDENENSSKAVICLKEEYPDDRAADPKLEHPIVVLADANRIVQVIANLLSNAVKFSTQRDRALITVTRGIRVIDGKPMAIVSVSDQGQGIKPEILSRLFQKFISGSEKGTGLGLYISKNIIKAHGGEIWAESNKSGIGASFVFTLPLSKS
jgi:two-component system, OmpR family, sensor histidine kinase VicK